MPPRVFGGAILTNTARNCRPCSRSVTQLPEADAYSPGVTVGACPISVIRSRSPLTFSRRTQKPLSALWNVTRSTRPESWSIAGNGTLAVMGRSLPAVPAWRHSPLCQVLLSST